MATERDGEFDMMEWMRLNTRWLVIGGAIVLAAAGGYWWTIKWRQMKAENAEKGLMAAQQSLASQNADLAKSDLKRVVDRYGSTSAGSQAALLLGQLNYDQGKYQEGIDVLRKAEGSAGANLANVRGLIADGLTMLGKLPEAASAYKDAAAAATAMPSERAYFLAKAARTYSAAGKTDEAKALWEDVVKNGKESPSTAAEARVRLAELTAKRAQ